MWGALIQIYTTLTLMFPLSSCGFFFWELILQRWGDKNKHWIHLHLLSCLYASRPNNACQCANATSIYQWILNMSVVYESVSPESLLDTENPKPSSNLGSPKGYLNMVPGWFLSTLMFENNSRKSIYTASINLQEETTKYAYSPTFYHQHHKKKKKSTF